MFLIFDIVRMIMFIGLGIAITVVFFYIDIMLGVGIAALVLWILFLYLLPAAFAWRVVQRAYLYYDIYNLKVVDDEEELECFVNHRPLTTYTIDYPLHE